MYYYTNGRPKEEIVSGLEQHSTLFKNREHKREVEESSHKVSAREVLKKFVPPIFLDIKRKVLK
jgi:hypothetical protein